MTRTSLASIVSLLALVPFPAEAAVTQWCDGNGTSPVVDGAIGASEYSGTSTGVGIGFSSILGADVTLGVESDTSGNLAFAIDGTAGDCTWSAVDTVVIYLDSIPGAGFADTSTLSDIGDQGRAGASGMGTDGSRATLTFAAGFGADYAIAIRNDSATLFRLVSAGSHAVVASLTRGPSSGFDTACVKEVGGITMADLGSQAGNPVHWVATLINASNAFRSNEFHGIAAAPGANIGAASFALSAGDFDTFESAAPPVGLSGPFVWVDFGTYAGAGFTPTPSCGQLSSNNFASTGMSDGALMFGATNTTGDYTRGASPGGVTAGGFYAFTTAANDAALGFQPSGADFSPGQVTLRLQNLGTARLIGASVEYRALYRNDQGHSDTLDFSHSTGGSSFTTVPALRVTTPTTLDALGWQSLALSTMITGLDVMPGSFLFLRFSDADAGGTGSRDELAIDDIVVHPIFAVCGDATVDPGELCDTGASNGSTTCGCQVGCSFGVAGAACGGGGLGPCDQSDTCDGSGACANRVLGMGTVCNPSSGAACDLDDTCDGTTTGCAARFATAGTVCNGASAGACDADDVCNGTDAVCAPRVAIAGTVCNASSGAVCDADDVCNGTNTTCTPRFAAAGTICLAANPAQACDADDLCSGTSTTCAPVFASAGMACRASTGTCDLGASCSGTAAPCPASTPASVGTPCRATAGMCDLAEACDGSLSCPTDAFVAAAMTCRASAGACDAAEACSGSDAACPADLPAVDGTACGDGMMCNGNETCMSGTCGSGTPLSCDDTNLCTTDSCAEPGGCAHAAIAGCCNVTADCDDTDLCTADSCSGPGGSCGHAAISDCCVGDTDCMDASTCTADSCNTTTNRCVFAPIAGCCSGAGDCDDGNVCTADSCDGTRTCHQDPVTGCCRAAGDCDDGDACTTDACATDNTCTNDAIANCCASASDCDDGDVCTTDSCVSDRCEHADACIDGGAGDAGTGTDAAVGTDAGRADAGGFDAGPGGVSGSGCACRAASSPREDAGGLVALAGIALTLLIRRRRR